LNNQIKLVNPLWVHDSVTKEELLDIEKYLIKKNYTEIYIQNGLQNISNITNSSNGIKKRKFNDLSKSPDSKQTGSKKKKTDHVKTEEKMLDTVNLKDSLVMRENKNESNISRSENKIETKPNNKITSFFKPVMINKATKTENENFKIEENANTPIIDESALIKVSSINIGEVNKHKLLNCIKSLSKYKYIGEKIESINDSEYIVITTNQNKHDLKYIHCLLNNKNFIDLKYFTESLQESKYKENIKDYLKSPNENESNDICVKELPFKKEKFQFYLHPNIYEKEPLRKDIFVRILNMLGVDEIETNIRQADICIVNKEDINEYFPGHIKLLNENFIFDCFYNFKVMDLHNIRYTPEKGNFKQNK
jgi:hypothetical protein